MKAEMTRFDTRLPESQKEFFQYAANLGGYRTLSEFVIVSVQSKAEEIVEKHKAIIASAKDQQIFFDAIMNPPAPSRNLRAAVKKYNKQTKTK
ncbi:MAG: DUF1778 domain-containing protein [Citrobacter freundii]|nr:MAG: DUF1778 domain-containing protein [Citrobacter freundii]